MAQTRRLKRRDAARPETAVSEAQAEVECTLRIAPYSRHAYSYLAQVGTHKRGQLPCQACPDVSERHCPHGIATTYRHLVVLDVESVKPEWMKYSWH